MSEEPTIFEPAPKLESFTCKVLVWVLIVGLYSVPFVFGCFGWSYFNVFVGFGFFCFGYLVNGIIHSKLRQFSIPPDQFENSYSTKEIACWFVHRYLMCR